MIQETKPHFFDLLVPTYFLVHLVIFYQIYFNFQMDGQQKMIHQVNEQSNQLEETMEVMRRAREESTSNIQKVNNLTI